MCDNDACQKLYKKSVNVLCCSKNQSGLFLGTRCIVSYHILLSDTPKTMVQHAQNMLVCSIRILQGSAAMRFGCGEIFSESFVANFPEIASKRTSIVGPLTYHLSERKDMSHQVGPMHVY